MHHTRKKKALSLIGEEKDFAAISKLLLENDFTEQEVGEILNEIESAGGSGADVVKGGTPGPTPKEPGQPEKKIGYEQWRMERNGEGKLEKLKLLRSGVKITEAEAETLNQGAASPGAVNPIMYFLPE